LGVVQQIAAIHFVVLKSGLLIKDIPRATAIAKLATAGRHVGVILDNRRLGRVSFTPVDSVHLKMRGD
jgi:hypothetical protein